MTNVIPLPRLFRRLTERDNVVYATFGRRSRLTQPVVFGLLLEWPNHV